jgi:hypothetical protein
MPDMPEIPEQEIISPAPPVEEASVEFGGDEDIKKKRASGKSTLKIPLVDTSGSGIRI